MKLKQGSSIEPQNGPPSGAPVTPLAVFIQVPNSPDKKTFLASAKKAWDATHTRKRGRTHDQRIIEVIKEVLIAWPVDRPYSTNAIIKRVIKAFEKRKELYGPVESSIRRYARLFLLVLQPFHEHTVLTRQDVLWLKAERGMPRSAAAMRAVHEAAMAVIPHLHRRETEWERLYKSVLDLIGEGPSRARIREHATSPSTIQFLSHLARMNPDKPSNVVRNFLENPSPNFFKTPPR